MEIFKKHRISIIFVCIIIVIFIAGGFFDLIPFKKSSVALSSNKKQNDSSIYSSIKKEKAKTDVPSVEKLNEFLFVENSEKSYDVTIRATDDYIKNHKDEVWNNLDFWIHRGTAFYLTGDCTNAFAAFWHANGISANNEIVKVAMKSILNNDNNVCKEQK